MSQAPYIAVVLDGGLVQTIIVEAWPPVMPLPCIVIVDYDIDDADDDELTVFTIGTDEYEAYCRCVEPIVYESLDTALSPRNLLTDSDDEANASTVSSPLAVARALRKRILELDGQLNDQVRVPTADDYHRLYALANDGLIDVLKALGDPTG